MKEHSKVKYSHIPFFKNTTPQQWDDWKWQMGNAIRDVDTLSRIIELQPEEKENLRNVLTQFKMSITPYYAALMDRAYKLCSVRLQDVPSIKELDKVNECFDDPLHEDVDSVVPGLTHRYPDRVLFLVTNVCSMY